MRLTGLGPEATTSIYWDDSDPDTQAIAAHMMGVLAKWTRLRRLLRWTYDETCGTCDFGMVAIILIQEGYDWVLNEPETLHGLVEATILWGRKTFGKANVG